MQDIRRYTDNRDLEQTVHEKPVASSAADIALYIMRPVCAWCSIAEKKQALYTYYMIVYLQSHIDNMIRVCYTRRVKY